MPNLRRKKAVPTSNGAVTSISVPAETTVKRIKSQEIFQQMNEVEIDHDGRIYRLRVTQFNKLILTA